MDFSKRSYEKELLDASDIPFKDIRRNMDELEFINAHLGGHKITIAGLSQLASVKLNKGRPLLVAEIGCGGGDNLVAIRKWCKTKGLELKVIGIDINPHCIEVAKKKLGNTNAMLISSDYTEVQFHDQKPDIIFSSLFCHHFQDEELTGMLKWMQLHAKNGFFINDLHRHPLAYYLIKFLSAVFSRSYLLKNDAPLSVRRGFKRTDWEKLLREAGIKQYTLHWKWAFRYLLVVERNNSLY